MRKSRVRFVCFEETKVAVFSFMATPLVDPTILDTYPWAKLMIVVLRGLDSNYNSGSRETLSSSVVCV